MEKMIWVRYWKSVRGTIQEEYHKFQDGTPEKYIELHCETWAEEQTGGHNTQYKYGYEIVNPPKEVIEKKIKDVKGKLSQYKAELDFLEAELKR